MKLSKRSTSNNLKLSVAIISKDRSKDLLECLMSLVVQKVSPDEVVIVDNSLGFETKTMVKNLRKVIRLPIIYVRSNEKTFGGLRNFALSACINQWVAFIDDDCVADYLWVKEVKQTISTRKHTHVFLGKTSTYYKKNLPSLLTLFLENYWKQKNIKNHVISNLEVIDTKNLVVNKKNLEKKSISFRTVSKFRGKGEDCLFGIDLQVAGTKAIYLEKILVSHKYVQTWMKYYPKLIEETLAYYFNVRQHSIKNLDDGSLNRLGFPRFFKKFSKENKLSISHQLGLLFHAIVSISLIKVIRTGLIIIRI